MAFQDWQNQAFQGSHKKEIWAEVSIAGVPGEKP